MENVEYVVRERNRAYFELETGVSGEAERRIQTGPFGLPVGYTPKVISPENCENNQGRVLTSHKLSERHYSRLLHRQGELKFFLQDWLIC